MQKGLKKRAFSVLGKWLLCVVLAGSVVLPYQAGSVATAAVNTQGEQIAAKARSLVGTKYLESGVTPQGFSGPGFVYYLYKLQGINVSNTLGGLMGAGQAIAYSETKPGDLVFIMEKDSQKIEHVGIYLGDHEFVVSAPGTGGVKVHTFEKTALKNRYAGARTLFKNQTLADKIIATGNQYLGTPYQYGARNYATSGKFDCSSFTQWIFGKNGITLPRSSRQQATVGTYVPRSQLKKGDLVFFSASFSNGGIGHVGVYVGDGKILHTYGPGGVRYDTITSGWLDKNYITARRVL